MAKWIRNFYPLYEPTYGWGGHMMAMTMADILRVAGYTLNSDSGHAAWDAASNIIVDEAGGGGAGTGFQVDATRPLEIYDTQGRFTEAMVTGGYSIFLWGGVGNYDQNHSAWRIVRYIDANRVQVEQAGWNPNGWATDTQMAGRVAYYRGSELSNGSWAIFDSPPGSRYQVVIRKTLDYEAKVQVVPMGKPNAGLGAGGDTIGGAAPSMTLNIAGGSFNKHHVGLNVTISGASTPANDGTFLITAVRAPNQITYTNASGVAEGFSGGAFSVDAISTQIPGSNGVQIQSQQYFYANRMNMYVDDNVFHFFSHQTGDYWTFLSFGYLTETAPEDTDPVYIMGHHSTNPSYPWTHNMYMLNGNPIPAQISCYPMWPKVYQDQDDASSIYTLNSRKVVNGYPGKSSILEPWVRMGDTLSYGACTRGRMQKFGMTYAGFTSRAPMDSGGAWWHWTDGLCVPRNGTEDPNLLFP